MKMIDILKQELKDGMTIENDRELSDKYKLTIVYDGMAAPVVLGKTCTPGCEKEVCRKAIDTALSTMYVNEGNLAEAKKWLDGEFWKNIDDESGYRRVNNDTWICNQIEELVGRYEAELNNTNVLTPFTFEDGRMKMLKSVINDLKEILY